MCLNPYFLRRHGGIYVPCGKCFECRVMKSTEWAYRIVDEARLHRDNCMITLTYDDAFLPSNRSVDRRELSACIKRLRKVISPVRIRFFGCGEYGEQRLRPHYHFICFGWAPPDAYLWKKDKKGTSIYRSAFLENEKNGVWKKGFSSVIMGVTPEIAKYVAVYLQKPPADGRLKPFVSMSLRPGIGRRVINEASWLTDKLYQDGHYIKLPRYYLTLLDRAGYDVESLKGRRLLSAREYQAKTMYDMSQYLVQLARRIETLQEKFRKPLDKNYMI